jgi:hypothetical protein
MRFKRLLLLTILSGTLPAACETPRHLSRDGSAKDGAGAQDGGGGTGVGGAGGIHGSGGITGGGGTPGSGGSAGTGGRASGTGGAMTGAGGAMSGTGGGASVGSGGSPGTGGIAGLGGMVGTGGTGAPGGGGAAGKTNGSACSGGGECASGNCVSNVCCNEPCTSRCYSCSSTLSTGQTGQCLPVRAGLVHGTDCSTTNPSTCGQDGKCDGMGNCRLHVKDTVCGGETCTPGTSNYSPMSTCDGRGACVAASASCGSYKCTSDGVRCRVSCGVDTECTPAAYCDLSVCRQRKESQALCSRPEECTSGLCGGRCCPAGSPCRCTQPSSANLLRNAGFDSSLTSWKDGGVQATWSQIDSEGCPYSGSVSLGDTATGDPSQCVAVNPGVTYNFGGWVKKRDGGTYHCMIYFYPDVGCIGEPMFGGGFSDPNRDYLPSDWIFGSMAIDAPISAFSAAVRCDVNHSFVDRLFLSPAPAMF